MEERAVETIRHLPRGDLEAFALRAVAYMRQNQKDVENSHFFSAVLMGFLLGALVASAAFLVGASLG
jgi:hypothetical protein